MKPTKAEYEQMTKKASPPSPKVKNCVWAFSVGGLLCAVGELECQLLVIAGMEQQTARTLTSCSLILLAAVLTVAQVFDNIAKHAGAGTLVPITGFANSVVSPAIEFKSDESDIIGHSQKDLIDKGRVWRFSLT